MSGAGRAVAIAGLVFVMLFLVGQWMIALYLAHSAVASAFGAAGSLVIILVWVYYSSQILFFGAELTKVYARTYGSLALSLGLPLGTAAVSLPGPAGNVSADATHVEPRT